MEAYLYLRHHEFCARLGDDDSALTVAVVLTPRPQSEPPVDTTMGALSGPSSVTPAEVERLTKLWRREEDVILAPTLP
jgi:hypothetical protein